MNLPEEITKALRVCTLQIFYWAQNINDEGGGEPPFLHSQVSDWNGRPGYFFALLQVHMQGDIHYSSARKGALYKEVHIYGIFQQRSNRSSITIIVSVYVLCVAVPTGLHTVSRNSVQMNVQR